jgi:hypothetical protein
MLRRRLPSQRQRAGAGESAAILSPRAVGRLPGAGAAMPRAGLALRSPPQGGYSVSLLKNSIGARRWRVLGADRLPLGHRHAVDSKVERAVAFIKAADDEFAHVKRPT